MRTSLETAICFSYRDKLEYFVGNFRSKFFIFRRLLYVSDKAVFGTTKHFILNLSIKYTVKSGAKSYYCELF